MAKDSKQEKDFKGKKSSKGKGFRPKRETCEDRTINDFSNDVHWYGTDDMLKLAGNLSFFTALGLPLTDKIYTRGVATNYVRETVPGIMAIELLDTLPVNSGSASQPSISPVNVAARQQYALIRKANSGAKNYEWTDLIIYELARSSINEVYAFIARAYGVANTYSMQNRYLPRTLLSAMGFAPDDFISNLASIRLWLNNFARRANTLALPHSLTLFERKAWLYSAVYTDSQSAKSQIYMFVPGRAESNKDGGFHVYNSNLGTAGAGGLERKALFANGNQFQYWSIVADSWLDILLSDDDCAIISGDILKAYGDNNLFKCNPIPEDFTITPVYNQEVLSQIENLNCAPARLPTKLVSDTGDDILLHQGAIIQTGAAGDLQCLPAFPTGQAAGVTVDAKMINPVINFHHTDVTPGEVMVATRLTASFLRGLTDSGNNNQISLVPVSCGTEIAVGIVVYWKPRSGNTNYTVVVNQQQVQPTANAHFAFHEAIALSNFDWAPKMYYYCSSSGAGAYPPIGDLDTYRVMEINELEKLHDTATLYMFAVPLISSYN